MRKRAMFKFICGLATTMALGCSGSTASKPQQEAAQGSAPVKSAKQKPPAKPAVEPATLVLRGGTVVTVDETKPRAQALAARGDRIVAIGSDQEIAQYVGDTTEVFELEGRMAMPGFVEGHAHFLSIGNGKLQLDLNHVANWDEVVTMVKEAVARAEPGQWVFGRGWHQSKWDKLPDPNVEGFPTHDSLSAVSPDNPVLLTHASGHAVFANAKAMSLASVEAKTKNPSGGEILRDAKGRAVGVFRETASSLVSPKTLPRDPATERKKAKLAAEECLAKGITSFQDAGSSLDDVALFKELAAADQLGVRLWVMLDASISNDELAAVLPTAKYRDSKHHRLAVAGIKRYVDGALGSHGAWLIEPYTDLPETSGLAVDSIEALTRAAELARDHGFQLCTHAIGDRGNREMLDIYAKVLGPDAKSKDYRWRIEHAQHVQPDDVPRFAELGVIASMQAVHCTSDGPWVPQRLGAERAEKTSYLWKSMIDAGVVVTNGTDAPVEDVDPLASYYAAVSRQLKDGTQFFPAQVMSREQALRSYTLDAAYAAFEDDVKGSLVVGKLADITVLSKDITKVDVAEIPKTKVDATIVGGQVRYRNKG